MVVFSMGPYLVFLMLLTTEWFQRHVIYLHGFQMTQAQNLDVPEVFGFLHNQVTPFTIRSSDTVDLYTWHVLPLTLYRQHEHELLEEPSGFASDIRSRLAFQLLLEDPHAFLVIHLHGAGGTVGSGYRPLNYRTLTGQAYNVHVLAFDYRGFGCSSGSPSEHGLIADAIYVIEWALHVAQIPPDRIVLFGQSLGTAVNIAAAYHYAQQEPATVFAGHVLVAPFSDVASLSSTYRVAGILPVVGFWSSCPILFDRLKRLICDHWPSGARLLRYTQVNERHKRRYRVTLLHAEDDHDIPWQHTSELFKHAVNGTENEAMSLTSFQKTRSALQADLGPAGSVVEWRTTYGVIREEISKHGRHDVLMSFSIVVMAVMRIFEESGMILAP